MKKSFVFLLVVICLFLLVSCNKAEPENQPRVQRGEPGLYVFDESNTEETEPTEPGNSVPVLPEARLIVNGKDITESTVVSIDYSTYAAEIPVLAVFRELGYDAQMQYVAETDSYIALIGQEDILLDTQYEDYGLSTRMQSKYVRRMEDGDFIVDSYSLSKVIYWPYNIEIDIDYHSGIVYVDSFDMFDCEELECSLIINGKEISKDNYTRILEFHTDTVVALPLLAIVTEIGAEVEWESETVVAVTYDGETKTYDTTDSGFNIPVLEGGICVRKIVNGDLVFDLLSIESTLRQEYGVNVTVDKENCIVYIDSVERNRKGIENWFSWLWNN